MTDSAQVDYWNQQTARSWADLQGRIDAIYAPLTELALQAAAPQPGERVLDIGSGCGATVLELAARVGPQGRVTGVDISQPMSERARERIAEAGLGQAEIVVADAGAHDFSAPHDLLFSRFGVMFFDDPVAAFANLGRATRPGGRFLFVVWRALAENPWFQVPLQAAAPLLGPAPESAPAAPGPEALADPQQVRCELEEAGWREVALTRQDLPLSLPGHDELALAADIVMAMGPLARRLVGLEPTARGAVKQAVRTALHDREGVLTASVWLVSGVRP